MESALHALAITFDGLGVPVRNSHEPPTRLLQQVTTLIVARTQLATVPDMAMTEPVHRMRDRRDLLPGEHYLDFGYPSAELMVPDARGDHFRVPNEEANAQTTKIQVIFPTRSSAHRRAHQGPPRHICQCGHSTDAEDTDCPRDGFP
ncbi:MAG: hypothetical protein ACREQ5_02370 [Candidatus Dormibacteria bacterium]